MAKREMITRSVESTKVVALCADTVHCEMENQVVKVTGTFSLDKSEKLLKAVKDAVETPTLKVVSIVSQETESKLYGMYTDDFIANAMELDEKRNPIKRVSIEKTPVE